MSHRPVCALAASAAALIPVAPLHADLQYIFEGQVASIDADLTGTQWDGVSIGDPFLYTVTIDPGAAVTNSPNIDNKHYANAILDFAVTIGSISHSGIPDPPEHATSGLSIVNDNPNENIAAYVDTPTYDIYAHIRLDPSTYLTADIFTTPGTYFSFAPLQSSIALNDGFDGFIAIDTASLTVTPTPATILPLLPLIPLTSSRRRR